MSKTRLNLSIDQDLADFVKGFAAKNRLSVADVVTQYFLSLQQEVNAEPRVNVLADPVFGKAFEESKAKLRAGKAQWHSYEEVFGD